MCSFIDKISSKHDPDTASKLNLLLLTLHPSLANVSEFYETFTFRFSSWAFFDTQLMNFIWKHVFLIIQDLRPKFTSQRVTKVLFLLWKFARPFKSAPIVHLKWWDWRSRNQCPFQWLFKAGGQKSLSQISTRLFKKTVISFVYDILNFKKQRTHAHSVFV